MGDLIHITTTLKQENIFYRITSGSLRFQVKGRQNAGIGLAKTPGDEDVLWFVLARDGRYTTIEHRERQLHVIVSSDIVSAEEFREFWIQWHGNIISLGRDYEQDPFLMCSAKTRNIKYVTFGVSGNNQYSVQWKFEMPPLRELTKFKQISNKTPQWVTADVQLPDGALIGGYEKELLYIIRAKHEGSLTPGKFVPSLGLGYIPWGGITHEKSELEVLCGYDCIWLPCTSGRIPAGSVVAGYAESSHETLYVGRAVYNNHLVPGKVQPSHRVCYIPYDDQEIAKAKYEILVVPHQNVQCANPFFVRDHAIRMK